jgi:hypothetical protein
MSDCLLLITSHVPADLISRGALAPGFETGSTDFLTAFLSRGRDYWVILDRASVEPSRGNLLPLKGLQLWALLQWRATRFFAPKNPIIGTGVRWPTLENKAGSERARSTIRCILDFQRV